MGGSTQRNRGGKTSVLTLCLVITAQLVSVSASVSSASCAVHENFVGEKYKHLALLNDGRKGSCNAYIQDRLCDSVVFNPGGIRSRTKLASNSTGEEVIPFSVNFGFIGILSGQDSLCETTPHLGMMCGVQDTETAPDSFSPLKLNPLFANSLGLETGGISASWCLHQLKVPALLGPSFSGAATGAATVGKILEIPMIGTTASSQTLSNTDSRTGYTTLSRVMPSDRLQSRALVMLARNFGWNNVLVVSMANDEYCTGLVGNFISDARLHGITISDSITFSRSARDGIDNGAEYSSVVERILKNPSRTRVVLLVAYAIDARAVLRAAEDAGLLNTGWAWMGTDSWMSDIADPSCGSTVPSTYAQGIVGVVPHVAPESQSFKNLNDCYRIYATKSSDVTSRFGGLSWLKPNPSWTSAYMYDATLALYGAVERVRDRFFENNNLNKADVNHFNEFTTQLEFVDARREILSEIRNSSFMGATGLVEFDRETGERLGAAYDFVNIQKTTSGSVIARVVGNVTMYSDKQRERNKDLVDVGVLTKSAIVFPGNSSEIPISSAYTCKVDQLNESEKAIGDLSCFIGMMLAFTFAVFNVLYRRNKIVRVSSWRINLVTIFGSFLLYMALNSLTLEAHVDLYQCEGVGARTPVMFSDVRNTTDWSFFDIDGTPTSSSNGSDSGLTNDGSDKSDIVESSDPVYDTGPNGFFDSFDPSSNVEGVCNVGTAECLATAGTTICGSRTWLFGIGYTLVFGSLFAKTYRISKLFSGSPVRRTIGDHRVLMYIVVVVFPMALYLFVWELQFPHKVKFHVSETSGPADDVITYIVRESCAGGQYHDIFMLIFVFYCFAMLVVGAFVAWSVKDVWIKEVNDSTEVAICIYTILVVGGLGYVVSVVLQDRTKSYLASTISVWICNTLVLCILYVPKIIEVWKRRGEVEITLGSVQTRVGIHEAEKLMDSMREKQPIRRRTLFGRLSRGWQHQQQQNRYSQSSDHMDMNPMYSSDEILTEDIRGDLLSQSLVSQSSMGGNGGVLPGAFSGVIAEVVTGEGGKQQKKLTQWELDNERERAMLNNSELRNRRSGRANTGISGIGRSPAPSGGSEIVPRFRATTPEAPLDRIELEDTPSGAPRTITESEWAEEDDSDFETELDPTLVSEVDSTVSDEKL